MELFQRATRRNYMFNTSKGSINVIDLWRLPLSFSSPGSTQPNLDSIAQELDMQIKKLKTSSFVKPQKQGRVKEELQDKFDIVLSIIQMRQSEAEAAQKRKLNQQKNKLRQEKLVRALENHEDSEINKKSKAELEEELKALREDY